jgi:DNA-binding CsgD family transcriptional regulator
MVGNIDQFTESSRVMEFENDSVLWMTHGSKGVFRFEFDNLMQLKGPIKNYSSRNGFPSNNINVFAINNQLVFAAEDGIYNFNYQLDAFEPNPFFNKWLGNNQVHFMCSNGSDAIYYIQNNHLGLLIQESFGKYLLKRELFRHINKFMNDDLPNITIIDNQNVLIGANEGFIHYNPQKPFNVYSDFSVLLRSVEVGITQDSIAFYDPHFLKDFVASKNQSLKFHYAAPYFDGFEDIQYSYRLLPQDKEWSKWSPSGEMGYPFLAPGNYTFEVKALNVYGKESTPSSFSFEIQKPWYATNLALAGYLILGLASIAMILMIQRNKYDAEKSIIRKDKEKALQQKNEEITKISKQSKEEIDRLMNEKLRTEIDLKNDQLTTLTMNFMNTNEFIQDSLKKIEAKLEKEGSTTELRNIIRSIYKNLSINDSWDQFAYHFDQVHGDYLKKLSDNNVNLSPREIKLAAFLRMNLSSKEISKMMNITERSVELARYRLRKKLKLEKGQNLVEYLIELDNR